MLLAKIASNLKNIDILLNFIDNNISLIIFIKILYCVSSYHDNSKCKKTHNPHLKRQSYIDSPCTNQRKNGVVEKSILIESLWRSRGLFQNFRCLNHL